MSACSLDQASGKPKFWPPSTATGFQVSPSGDHSTSYSSKPPPSPSYWVNQLRKTRPPLVGIAGDVRVVSARSLYGDTPQLCSESWPRDCSVHSVVGLPSVETLQPSASDSKA